MLMLFDYYAFRFAHYAIDAMMPPFCFAFSLLMLLFSPCCHAAIIFAITSPRFRAVAAYFIFAHRHDIERAARY